MKANTYKGRKRDLKGCVRPGGYEKREGGVESNIKAKEIIHYHLILSLFSSDFSDDTFKEKVF